MNHKERVKIRNELDRLERLQKEKYSEISFGKIRALTWVLDVCG